METNPEGTAQTYIFLVDNQDIALNIVMSGYQALCLVQEDDGYYFSADSFIEEMRAIQFTGSCQCAYHYVALRNRNGLKSRSEQELLEEEIKDVRDQNSKLQIQVNKSSVEAVDEVQKKQKEAEKKMEQAESKVCNEKKRAELEIQKARSKAKREIDDMQENQYFWMWGYIIVILFSIIQNGAFQIDILQFVKTPVEWWLQYVEWFENLEYLGYTAGKYVLNVY